ncbi:MAG: cytidine deaminase [candidate division WOR-3 bacterium]
MKNRNEVKELKQVINFSYSPYSNFKVGALIKTKSNRTFTGVNIENASYGLTICAERVALFKALSEGERDFKTLLVYTPTKNFTYPCGACLQVLREHCRELKIILLNKDGKKKFLRLSQLLPKPFLGSRRVKT